MHFSVKGSVRLIRGIGCEKRTVFDLLDIHVGLLRKLNFLLIRRVRVECVLIKPFSQDFLLLGAMVVATVRRLAQFMGVL